MKKFSQGFTYLRSVLLLSILALPLFGTDCNNITTQNTGNIQGNWKLNFIQGNLQDVCLGEVVNFPSNTGGTATLTCPGGSPIQRSYTVSNNTLSYSTGVNYTITSATSSVLILTGSFTSNGVTSSRILSYSISSSESDSKTAITPGTGNSSEKSLSK